MGLKQTLMRSFYKVAFVTKKHSPEILVVSGVVAVAGGAVLACRATLKLESILDEHERKIDKIKADVIFSHQDNATVPYTQQDIDKDHLVARVTTGLSIVKTYLPAATLFIGGMVCILGAHNILKKRNAALMAAYKLVEEGFMQYRRRVIEDQGEEKDFQYRYGLTPEETKEKIKNEKGKGIEVVKKKLKAGDKQPSIYARFFDETSRNWTNNSATNLVFVKNKEAFFNDLLLIRGVVLLNDVYDQLGFDRTPAGAIVGWTISDNGDNYVDFGIYDLENASFINGTETSILLDFNVDGVVYDKIHPIYDPYSCFSLEMSKENAKQRWESRRKTDVAPF